MTEYLDFHDSELVLFRLDRDIARLSFRHVTPGDVAVEVEIGPLDALYLQDDLTRSKTRVWRASVYPTLSTDASNQAETEIALGTAVVRPLVFKLEAGESVYRAFARGIGARSPTGTERAAEDATVGSPVGVGAGELGRLDRGVLESLIVDRASHTVSVRVRERVSGAVAQVTCRGVSGLSAWIEPADGLEVNAGSIARTLGPQMELVLVGVGVNVSVLADECRWASPA